MIILIPLAVTIGLVAWVLHMVAGLVIGFFCGPCFISEECDCCECLMDSCFAICCCPLMLVMGAVLGFFAGVYVGLLIVLQFLKEYFIILMMSLCGCDFFHFHVDYYGELDFDF